MTVLDPSRSFRCHAKRHQRTLMIAVMLTIVTPSSVATAHDGRSGPPLVVIRVPTASNGAPGLLRIEVDPSIEEATLLNGWIHDRNISLAEKLAPAGGHEQWIAVKIGGSTYDYRVSVVAMREGQPVGAAAEPEVCECNNEKLLELVDARIAAAADALRTASSPDAAPAPIEQGSEGTGGPGTGSTAAADRLPRSRTMGQVGFGVGVLGAMMLAAGIPLAWRPDEIRGGPGQVVTRSTRDTGIGLAVGGGVAVAAGVSLVMVDLVRRRQRPRSVAVVPTLGFRQLGIAVSW